MNSNFSILSSRFYDLHSFIWKLFSNFVHISFEVLLLVFLSCTMLLAFFGVGGSRACMRPVQPTSSDVGRYTFQSVSIIDRLEVGRWKFVFPMFGSDCKYNFILSINPTEISRYFIISDMIYTD